MKKYIIVNIGSASKKYSLYEDSLEIMRAHFEKEGSDFILTEKSGEIMDKKRIYPSEYLRSGDTLLKSIMSKGLVKNISEISALGFRIVSPGEYFAKTRLIDKKYREKLERNHGMAPLHTEAILKSINEFSEFMPDAIMLGVSDSAFHSTMPEASRNVAIPKSDAEKFDIYRYGYHGISVQSALDTTKNILGDNLPTRVIVCHLGGGSSITAVKDGRSIDTSMGLTPLEGLVMATRSGDIDPGALIHLAKHKKLSLEGIDRYLNNKCGLLGLSSGKESGIRELLDLEKNGDKDAKIALEMWVYRIKKYIGSYIAVLGGLDLLIFTATIGERSFIMRERICLGLEHLGIVINKEENNRYSGGKSGMIDSGSSLVKIAVVATDEMGQIAEELRNII